MGNRSGLGVAERREAVLSLIRRDEPAAVIARRFGVSEQSLYRWRDGFDQITDAADDDSGGTHASDPSSPRYTYRSLPTCT